MFQRYKVLVVCILSGILFFLPLAAQPEIPIFHIDTVYTDRGYTDTIALHFERLREQQYRIVGLSIAGDTATPFSLELLNSDSILTTDAAILIRIRCSPRHNLWYRNIALITVRSSQLQWVFPFLLSAKCYYPDDRYRFTWNRTGAALVDALYDYLKVHQSYPYAEARRMLFEVVAKYSGDTIECIYSGRKIVARTYTEVANQGFNTEHTWPRSYGAENEPPLSDLHHLFPSDQKVNEKRANYPFGIVTGTVLYEAGGSKLGYNSSNQLVFDVRPERRGDIARALFYFAVRYRNPQDFLGVAAQESVLRQWHSADPVDTLERLRNQRIQAIQYRPNPFIDHPEFVERIRSFRDNPDFPGVPVVAFADSVFAAHISAFPDTLWIPIINTGTDSAEIWSASIRGVADTTVNIAPFFSAQWIAPQDVQMLGIAIDWLKNSVAGHSIQELMLDTLEITVRFRNGVRPIKTRLILQYDAVAGSIGMAAKERSIPAVISNEQINIVLPRRETGMVYAVACYSSIGRSVQPHIRTGIDNGEQYSVTVDFRSLPRGFYWIRILTAQRTITVPVIVGQ